MTLNGLCSCRGVTGPFTHIRHIIVACQTFAGHFITLMCLEPRGRLPVWRGTPAGAGEERSPCWCRSAAARRKFCGSIPAPVCAFASSSGGSMGACGILLPHQLLPTTVGALGWQSALIEERRRGRFLPWLLARRGLGEDGWGRRCVGESGQGWLLWGV